MTRQILSTPTEVLFYDLVEYVAKPYISTADEKRMRRLATIVAARQGMTLASVFTAARYEARDLDLAA